MNSTRDAERREILEHLRQGVTDNQFLLERFPEVLIELDRARQVEKERRWGRRATPASGMLVPREIPSA